MSSTRLLHVVGAGAQLVEARRVHAVLLGRPAGDRVEPDVRDVEVEELPHVGAVGHVLDARRDVLVLRGQVVLEHVGRFDHVVVDADQDHVLDAHGTECTPIQILPNRPILPYSCLVAGTWGSGQTGWDCHAFTHHDARALFCSARRSY